MNVQATRDLLRRARVGWTGTALVARLAAGELIWTPILSLIAPRVVSWHERTIKVVAATERARTLQWTVGECVYALDVALRDHESMLPVSISLAANLRLIQGGLSGPAGRRTSEKIG